MVRFLETLLLISLLALGDGQADAADPRYLPKIGQVFGANPVVAGPFDEAFREGLRSLGYVDGQNVTLVPRYAHGDSARFPALLRELIALDVDVLVVAHTAIPAALQLTKTIPIVCPTMDDPIRAGFVTSFARPGANLTGLYGLFNEMDSKRLELTMEVLPGLRRAMVMFEATDASVVFSSSEFRTLARKVGVTLQLIGVRNWDEMETVLKGLERNRPQALFLFGTPLMYVHAGRIITESNSHKVPVVSDGSDFAKAGALLSYSADLHAMWKRAAVYVDKILKGIKPGDLPIEQPSKFELIVNLRTASELGITVPDAILVRADKIIR